MHVSVQNYFTARLCTNFLQVEYIQPCLNDAPVLPYETAMFQKSYKFKNTVMKHPSLLYFWIYDFWNCRSICWRIKL